MTTPQDTGEPSVASLGSKPLTFGSLFAGIGGFDLGLERAGMRCEWQVEIDPYARAVLAKHWPDVRRHEDVRTFPPPEGEWGVDVICGGFPCQDISVAGKGAGLAGARSGLWYEYARIIGELRPRYVIVENVAALLARGMGTVLGDLSSLGYDAEWHVVPASAVGAPHRRDRVWIVAVRNANSKREACYGISDAKHGRAVSTQARREPARVGGERDVADASGGRPQGNRPARDEVARESLGSGLFAHGSGDGVNGWWSVEPDVGRVAHGVPARVDRLRCLGNAVVPQIVEVIGRAIVEAA
jgi:DNA (cytosine-5)-methyltransferase 1